MAAFSQNPRFSFSKADVAQPEQVDASIFENLDCVFHFAGKKMAFSVKAPQADLLANIYGTLNVLRWASEKKAKRFVFASSVAVYGNPKTLPSDEKTLIIPTNPYGVSKFSCEEYCRLWHREYQLPVVIFRFASVYGPRQASNVGVVNAFIGKISQEEPIVVFGDGTGTRPFTHVEDVVLACMLAANTANQAVLGETFNVSSGESVSINRLVEIISAKLGKKPRIRYEKERPGEMKHMAADIQKAKKMLLFEPSVSIEEGLSRTVDYYEKNRL